MTLNPSKQETGQGLIEYALIVVLVGITVISGLMVFGPPIGGTFSTINSSLPALHVGGIPIVVNATAVPSVVPTITPTVDPHIAYTITPTTAPTITPTIKSTPTKRPTPLWCDHNPWFCR